MKKKIKREIIPFDFDWTYGIEISKLKEDLNTIEALGATTIEIEPYDNYGSACVKIQAFFEREETDEECRWRVKEVEIEKERQKQYDLMQLERIKAKYNL